VCCTVHCLLAIIYFVRSVKSLKWQRRAAKTALLELLVGPADGGLPPPGEDPAVHNARLQLREAIFGHRGPVCWHPRHLPSRIRLNNAIMRAGNSTIALAAQRRPEHPRGPGPMVLAVAEELSWEMMHGERRVRRGGDTAAQEKLTRRLLAWRKSAALVTANVTNVDSNTARQHRAAVASAAQRFKKYVLRACERYLPDERYEIEVLLDEREGRPFTDEAKLT